jgi:site-specific DNA-adenine methylase
MGTSLKPFWRYYGGKYRAAPRYPKPQHKTLIEPFAGAAGYSLRYPDLEVVLVDAYPVIAEMWRYLITTPAAEIRSIPYVESVDDLPSWVPQGARYLVGFTMNAATVSPCRVLSSGRKKLREMGRKYEGWSEAMRERVASQVERIRHWRVIEGDYTQAPDVEATWFVDPPYNNRAGSYYVHSGIDYAALGAWCKSRRGQVLVCENEGADWLPFQSFATFKAGVNGSGSREVLWQGETNATPRPLSGSTSGS